LLNQITLSPTALIYNEARYLEEMGDAIEKWEARLLTIIKE
jgi:hypothetical protein